MRILQKYQASLLALSGLTALVLFWTQSLLATMSTALYDWYDYPYVVWIVSQNIDRWISLDFQNLFSGNIFFPHRNTLFFADLFWPQTLLSLPARLFSTNPLFLFNVGFVLTLLGNAYAGYWFWGAIYTRKTTRFLGAAFLLFSPYVMTQLSHYQMVTFWPFLLAAGAFLRSKREQISQPLLSAAMAGLLLTVQFLGGVYIAIFGIFFFALLFGTELLFLTKYSRQNIEPVLRRYSALALVFAISVLPFFWQYRLVQHQYGIERAYGEYVFYSAHVTDYLFSTPTRSIVNQLSVVQRWNRFNQHTMGELAAFPGATLLIFAFLGLGVQALRRNAYMEVRVQASWITTMGVFLTLMGFVFSLGPRLNVNGVFVQTLMPYAAILKLIPLVEPVRATSRWWFLIPLGLSFLALHGFDKLQQRMKQAQSRLLLTSLLVGALFIESSMLILPVSTLSLTTPAQTYLETHCQRMNTVLLEYPLNRVVLGQTLVDMLSYKSTMMLRAARHGCWLIDGYSGHTPNEIVAFEESLKACVATNDVGCFQETLLQKSPDFIKLNLHALLAEDGVRVQTWLQAMPNYTRVLEEENELIFQKNRL